MCVKVLITLMSSLIDLVRFCRNNSTSSAHKLISHVICLVVIPVVFLFCLIVAVLSNCNC